MGLRLIDVYWYSDMYVTVKTFLLSTLCLLFTCPFAYSNEIDTGHINSESSSLKLHKLSSTPGGVVAGWVPSADIYYIKLHTPVSSGAELTQILTDLENIPEVLTAEENAITN